MKIWKKNQEHSEKNNFFPKEKRDKQEKHEKYEKNQKRSEFK